MGYGFKFIILPWTVVPESSVENAILLLGEFWHQCRKSTDRKSMGLFLDSPFYSIDLQVYPRQHHPVLIPVVL